MGNIIPPLSTAVAGATPQQNPQAAAKGTPVAHAIATAQAASSAAADKAANQAEKKPRTRAPSKEKRVESPFAASDNREATGTNASEESRDIRPKKPIHDGKLDVVA